jgi:hypothetical protein
LEGGGDWDEAFLRSERERVVVGASVAAMRVEISRIDAEVQPLLTAFEAKPEPPSGERIPCELCLALVKVSDFQVHVQGHGEGELRQLLLP